MDDSRFSRQVSELRGRVAKLRTGGGPVHLELLLQDLQTAVEELSVADEEVRTQQEEVARLLEDQQLARWRYDRIMAALPVAVVTTDQNGRLRTVNPAAAAMLGAPLPSLLRKPLFAFVDPDDRGSLRTTLSEVVGTGSTRTQTVTMQLRDHTVELSASLSVTPQVAGEVTWVLLRETAGGDDRGSGLITLPVALLRLFSLAGHATVRNDILQQTAYIAAETLGEGTALSLVLGSPTAPIAVASSATDAQTLDAWQLDSAEGPSVSAVESCETVVSPDLRHDSRWAPPTAAHDQPHLVAAVAAPLQHGDDVEGVVTAYLAVERPVSPRLVEQIEVLSASIGSVLQELGLRTHLEGLTTDMQNALASRSVIEQAKGIVMSAKHCTADEAFQHLVTLSNTSHLKLRDVARHVVEGVGG